MTTKAEEALTYYFEQLEIPHAATAWLLDVWKITQAWDDVADGDPIERDRLDGAIWASLVTMPSNPFHTANAAALQPALAVMVLKWKASDQAERSGNADARSYMWRAGYYDLVLLVSLLTKGYASAMHDALPIMRIYGERLPEYLKEFGVCQSH